MVQMLVATASKHGSTHEIGQVIAAALVAEGVQVVIHPVDDVEGIDGADAVILGSGVYAGHWLAPARRFVDQFGDALRRRPVWLFSSGPLGSPPRPVGDPVDVAAVMTATSARGHRVFGGKLERDQLNFGERAVVKVVSAPYGDYRDWPEVTNWVRDIADSLRVAAGTDRTDDQSP